MKVRNLETIWSWMDQVKADWEVRFNFRGCILYMADWVSRIENEALLVAQVKLGIEPQWLVKW